MKKSNLSSRREFLRTASAATLSALAAGYPRQLFSADDPAPKIKPTADTVIVLWMAGGMAHTETFDPKRYTPFEAGMRSEEVLSTFPSIDTAVDGIKFSRGLGNIRQRFVHLRGFADMSADFCEPIVPGYRRTVATLDSGEKILVRAIGPSRNVGVRD